MAVKVDLEDYTLKDLQELRTKVEVAIREAEEREMAETREKMATIAAKAGFSITDLFPVGASGRRRSALKSKKPYPPPTALYRDPKNPQAKPWSGRGKRPGWLAEQLSKGRSLEDFKVSV